MDEYKKILVLKTALENMSGVKLPVMIAEHVEMLTRYVNEQITKLEDEQQKA